MLFSVNRLRAKSFHSLKNITLSIHNSYSWYQKLKLDLYVALHYSIVKFYNALKIMSTFASALYAVSVPTFDISLLAVVQISLILVAVGAFALLFKPLLVGIARAMVLVVRPKLSREQRLARQQLREEQALKLRQQA